MQDIAFKAMKDIIKKPGLLSILLIIALLSTFTACGQSSAQKPGGQQQSAQQPPQQHDKVPDQLKGIESSIESIIKTLGGPTVETEGGGKGGQQGGQQDPWAQITGVVNSLHYEWNAYMPMAAKAGATKTLLDNFSGSLNNLTSAATAKSTETTLSAANSLYSYVPDFYSFYKTQTSPEIKRIRYYTRDAMLSAALTNWTQVDNDIASLKSSWSIYKNILPKDQQENASKLDFSIYELEKVVKDRHQHLVDIKGRVTMSNIQEIEKAQSGGKKQGGGSQSGGGTSGGGSSGGGQS